MGQSPANLTQVTSCRGCLVFFGPYAWANFTILAVGVWAVAQRDSIDAISMVSWESSVGTCSIFPSPVPLFSLFLVPIFHFLKPCR